MILSISYLVIQRIGVRPSPCIINYGFNRFSSMMRARSRRGTSYKKRKMNDLDKTKSNSVVKLKYARYSLLMFNLQTFSSRVDHITQCRFRPNPNRFFAVLQCDIFLLRSIIILFISNSLKQFYQVYLFWSDTQSM